MSIEQVLTAPPAIIPDKDEQTPEAFDSAADAYVEWQSTKHYPQLVTWTSQANTLKNTMNGYKEDTQAALTAAEVQVGLAEAQVGLAEAQVSLAQTSAALSAISANVSVYSSGVSYSAGQVVFDPLDQYAAYTSQASDNQGHQPSTDPGTWWKPTFRPLPTYGYDDRDDLRALSAKDQDTAIIDGLGLFVFHSGSDEPDDDESCFSTSAGRWLLEAAHWDLVDAWQLPDDAARDDFDDDQAAFTQRFLYGTATCAITSVVSAASTGFTGTVTGAAVGDRVIVTAPAQLGATLVDTGCLSYHAVISAANTVTIYLTNASASTATTNTLIRTVWPCLVIKES